MNVRAPRVRWAALGALVVTASLVAVVAVRHHHSDSSALDAPTIANLLDRSGRALEARGMALSSGHHVKPSEPMAPTAPTAAACDFGHDRSCNEDASEKMLRGACRHDGSCECVAGSVKTADGRCR